MRVCILCGAPLPADRRWRIIRLLAPRFPRCTPATTDCYRRLADRIGAHPTEERIQQVVTEANKGRNP